MHFTYRNGEPARNVATAPTIRNPDSANVRGLSVNLRSSLQLFYQSHVLTALFFSRTCRAFQGKAIEIVCSSVLNKPTHTSNFEWPNQSNQNDEDKID
jgi:hypothetical protein